ncbi:MAG: hypothetical protein O3B13_00820 [Planctomycetota bacterium]|nr:hypothetical protein [Planctomycetota bacterium]MDA1161620.1 hypothetical protein [Planctomycetota bacterium]
MTAIRESLGPAKRHQHKHDIGSFVGIIPRISVTCCEVSAMFDSATRTATRYCTYYSEGLVSWWDHIGPTEYTCILVGVVVVGFMLLRNSGAETL